MQQKVKGGGEEEEGGGRKSNISRAISVLRWQSKKGTTMSPMEKLVTVTFFLVTINVTGLTSSSLVTGSFAIAADSAINEATTTTEQYTSVDFVHQKSTTHGNSSKSSDITSYSLPSMLTPANRTKSDRVTVSSRASSSSSFLLLPRTTHEAVEAAGKTIASQTQPPVTHKDLSKARSQPDQAQDLLQEPKNATLTQSLLDKKYPLQPSPAFGRKVNPLNISIVTPATHVLNSTSIDSQLTTATTKTATTKSTTAIITNATNASKERTSPVTTFNVTPSDIQPFVRSTSLPSPSAKEEEGDDSLLSGTIKHQTLEVTIVPVAVSGSENTRRTTSASERETPETSPTSSSSSSSSSSASGSEISEIKSHEDTGGKTLQSIATSASSHLNHFLGGPESRFNSSDLLSSESPKHTVKARKGVKEYPRDEGKLQVKARSRVDPLLHQYLLSGLIKSAQEGKEEEETSNVQVVRPASEQVTSADSGNARYRLATGDDGDGDGQKDADGASEGKGMHSHENWHHVNQDADADERRQNSSLHSPSPSSSSFCLLSHPSPASSQASASSDHERPFAADTKSAKRIFPFASFSTVILTTGNRSTHTSDSLADANITHVSSKFHFYPPKLTNHSTEKHFSTLDQTARKNYLPSSSPPASTLPSSLNLNSSETSFTPTSSSSARKVSHSRGALKMEENDLQSTRESFAERKSQSGVELNSISNQQNDALPSIHSQTSTFTSTGGSELHKQLSGHGKSHQMDHRIGRFSEEYYHVLIGLCFGFVFLIYVLIHIIVSVHDMLKRKRYGAMFESRRLIEETFVDEEP